jgi:hypothetical protein
MFISSSWYFRRITVLKTQIHKEELAKSQEIATRFDKIIPSYVNYPEKTNRKENHVLPYRRWTYWINQIGKTKIPS